MASSINPKSCSVAADLGLQTEHAVAGQNVAPPPSSSRSDTPSLEDHPLRDRSPQFAPDNAGRVFPVRSAFSIAPAASSDPGSALPHDKAPLSDEGTVVQTSTLEQKSQSEAEKLVNPVDRRAASGHAENTVVASHESSQTVAISHSSDWKGPPDGDGTDNQDEKYVTARFKHVVTDKGHAVITGRDGAALQYCEDEPIHIPGAVQGFGVMLALQQESDERLIVRVASENSELILGYAPHHLFRMDDFCDLLNDEQAEILLDHVAFVKDGTWNPSVDGPEVFIMPIVQRDGSSRRFWCAIHASEANRDLTICEFELEDDQIYPLNVSGETLPLEPASTLGADPSADDVAASSVAINQPLRVLRNSRRRRGEAAAMEVFTILSQVQEQLAQTETLDVLLNTAAGLIRELSGFHRVMIYQFDPSWNGIVVAELVDPRASKDLYKGLRFPASDIPKQARDLYKINKVRLLYDRDQMTARLVCRTVEDLASPVDMTHSYLRAMSPIHLKYMANMSVRASMSISIDPFNELWGLISCNSYGDSGMRVSFPIRKMCRLIGSAVSRNIERLSYASRLQARKLINTVPTETNPQGYIVATSDDLLKLFESDYGAVSIGDETKMLGNPPESQEILALLEYLRVRKMSAVYTSHSITKDFPDLRYPPGFKSIAGLLYVPLSVGGSDFIVYFRRPQVTEIKWGGNPYEKTIKGGTAGYLEPRKSFQTWRETVLNQSREWTESNLDTAAILCLVYGKFIKVWRQKEAAMQRSHLTKLLLANSAHEVRTPLNAIINYLEIALENSLDPETRENLVRSHSASKSLIYVINDLLDLTNAEHGRNLIKDESFSFHATIKEATEIFEADAKRKGIAYAVKVHPGVPNFLVGDQRRIRQAIMNLISNAVQNTSSGSITVEVWRSLTEPHSGNACVEVAIVDTGSGMSQATLEALFNDLEQVSADTDDDPTVFEIQQEPQRASSKKDPASKNRVLGLGLALVARIVRNLDGQLSVKSEEGKGSRFKILLQCPVAKEEAEMAGESQISNATTAPTTPDAVDGEIMLVNSNSPMVNSTRRGSSGSGRSGRSARSTKSNADRLIDAMQEPVLIGEGVKGPKASFSGSNRPAQSEPALHVLDELAGTPRRRASSDDLSDSGVASTVSPLNLPQRPGQEMVTDSCVPMKALKIPSASSERPPSPERQELAVDVPPSSTLQTECPTTTLPAPGVPDELEPVFSILVAEDDPINSKIIKKRLEKLGHKVHLTVNGDECATAYRSNISSFDVILMDIQVT